ncbi:hypothetical protein [Dickeya oryzae]|uniref:hypothetical protein n=1 Tax=Dickeya oryzae TaxID=1240404 RepID=UPI0003A84182|nr:hypothetical protein [Dickeya oryzae]
MPEAPRGVFPTLDFNTEQYPKQRTIQSMWENQNQPFDIKQGCIFISLLRIVPKRFFLSVCCYQCVRHQRYRGGKYHQKFHGKNRASRY